MQAQLIACPHWRQKLPKTATNCSRSYSRRKRQQKLRQIVAGNGNKCCRKQRLLLPFSATFVAVSCDNLSPFSATFVASVGRLLGQLAYYTVINLLSANHAHLQTLCKQASPMLLDQLPETVILDCNLWMFLFTWDRVATFQLVNTAVDLLFVYLCVLSLISQ